MSPPGPDPGSPDGGASAGSPAGTGPRRRRRLVRVAGVVALLAASIVVAHTPVVRDRVRRAAVTAAHRAPPLDLRSAAVWLRGRLTEGRVPLGRFDGCFCSA